MFSTQKQLDEKTGEFGVGRLSYLQSLVDEFQTTNLPGSKREIIANLANFAYDPINYEFFRQLKILDLFIDCLSDDTFEADPPLKLFSMAAICNCCLDHQNRLFLLRNSCVELVIKHLISEADDQMLTYCITSLMYLMCNNSRQEIRQKKVQDRMHQLQLSSNAVISNLATVFIEKTPDSLRMCSMAMTYALTMRIRLNADPHFAFYRIHWVIFMHNFKGTVRLELRLDCDKLHSLRKHGNMVDN